MMRRTFWRGRRQYRIIPVNGFQGESLVVVLPNEVILGWDNFFIIVGSSGAALIGLQFVVITLMSETRSQNTGTAIGVFATPTVMHFGAALLISAIMSAPWPTLFGPAVALGISGAAGLAYESSVFYRAHRQTVYKPVWEDWLWHIVLPSLMYALLTVAALFLRENPGTNAFLVAASGLGLLFIGIHNAWDTVIYLLTSPEPAKTDV
jgi:hypothetical protein